MTFYMPTKVYAEKECVEKYGKELVSLGTKAMIVTGKTSARKNGSLKDVEDVLKNHAVEYVIFDEIEENPSIETVMRAREIGIASHVDFVIGIGGGSPLDAAKAIALMIANPNEREDVLYTPKELAYLPIACIPTTCGTGSEVTPYAILTIHEKRTKKSISHHVYPTIALMDEKYLKSMPRVGLINTAVDALAHLVESYLNVNSNEWNRTYSREGLRVWGEFKEALAKDKLSDADYEKMLRASAIAGMAITQTTTSLPHGMSYTLTYELGIPHGRAVGYFLGGFVEVYEDREEVETVLELLGFANVTAFKIYLKDLFGEIEVPKDVLEKTITNILSDERKLKNYPFAVSKNKIQQMCYK